MDGYGSRKFVVWPSKESSYDFPQEFRADEARVNRNGDLELLGNLNYGGLKTIAAFRAGSWERIVDRTEGA